MAVKYLLKATEEYRLETLEDVKQFHETLEKDAAEQDYTLSSFGWTEKYEKEKSEIVGSYFVVKAVKTFDEAKAPEQSPLQKIEYTHFNVPSEFAPHEEEEVAWETL